MTLADRPTLTLITVSTLANLVRCIRPVLQYLIDCSTSCYVRPHLPGLASNGFHRNNINCECKRMGVD